MKLLTDKQQKFLNKYLENFNQKEALFFAYPNAKTWKESAQSSLISKLMKNNIIQTEILKVKDKTHEKSAKNLVLSKDKIIKEMINIYNDTRESGASERGYSLKAIELLAKAGKVLETSGQSINVNVINNNNMNEISNYLRLNEN